jgi:MFS family permease
MSDICRTLGSSRPIVNHHRARVERQTAPVTTTDTAKASDPWSPLRVRIFRSLWIASLVSNIGSTMHTVGASWAMTSLTKSPVVVSLVQTAWAVPGFLVAIPAGAFADVLDRRRLILFSQSTSLAFAGALGVLQATGHLTVPLLLAGTFLLSSVMTISAPAFMALTPELVRTDELAQAIGLNNIAYNGAQSVGPAIAGVVIAASGAGAVFILNAVSFLGIILVVWRYRPAERGPRSTESLGDAMLSGMRYFRSQPRLRVFVVRIFFAFLVTSSVVALLPVDARERLHATAGEFGFLAAALGVGAILAVWLLPHVRSRASADAIVLGAAIAWASGTGLIAMSTSLPLTLLGVALAGVAAMAALNIMFSMFMLMLPSWIRGRASSVSMLMVWLGSSLGALGWGTLASHLGLRTTFIVAAAAHLALVAAATAWFPLGDPQPTPE